MALVNADYKYIAVDIGSFGKNSDSGILSRSALGEGLPNSKLEVPKSRSLPGMKKPLLHRML